MLKLLIRSGAEVDVVVGVTPFLASWCWHGIEKDFEPALLSWLVRHGASADIEDRTGTSAWRRASRKSDKRYLSALSQ